MKIINPEGATVASTTFGGAITAFIDVLTLLRTATYTVLVDPTGSATGNVTLTLYDVPPDVTGTITPGGDDDAVPVTIGTPGQNAGLTFTGSQNQRVSLRATSGLAGTIALLNPDGSVLGSVTNTALGSFIDTKVLPSAGTYTVLADGSGAATGTTTLTLYDVPADLTGTLTIGAPAEPVTLSTPGQNAFFTFAGTASQQVTVRITGNTYGSVTVRLLRPDGTPLTSKTSGAGSFNLTTQTLPSTGTYTVEINPASAYTGTLNLSVTNP